MRLSVWNPKTVSDGKNFHDNRIIWFLNNVPHFWVFFGGQATKSWTTSLPSRPSEAVQTGTGD
jgi:hypothetical protein